MFLDLVLIRNLSRYLAIALTVIGIGISIVIQGAFQYFNGLASYRANLNFCKNSAFQCPSLPSFNGTQDFVLIGFGLATLCLGIALLFTELGGLPKLNTGKFDLILPKT